jgi:uncharacterized iron-regulated protein
MVYLVKRGNGILSFYSEASMKAAGFAAADKTVSEAEFATNGCYARLIDGTIVVGETGAEMTADINNARIDELKQKLSDTDYVVIKIAEGSATADEYKTQIAQRQEWRKELVQLSAPLAASA